MKKIQVYTVIWGMVIVSVFVLLTAFGLGYKKKVRVYKALENKIVEAEKKYVDAKFLYPAEKETLKTKAAVLIDNGYMEKLTINDEECDGYAIVTHDSVVYEYKGFIKCKNYKTKGYQE